MNDIQIEILEFWQDAGPSAWWSKDADFDARIKDKFGEFHEKAARRKYDRWREEAASCLALVIALDQFSRNLFRGSPKAFAQDEYALELAGHAVRNGFNRHEPKSLYLFFHLPFMHSENLQDQRVCVQLMRAMDSGESLKAAIEHHDIIARFGRFPHRNQILGRETSKEEREFLDSGGFSG